MSKSFLKNLAFAVAATGLLAAGEAAARPQMMQVRLLKSQTATFPDGSSATVYVVRMNGHTMVAIPEANISDPLHQQIFRPRP